MGAFRRQRKAEIENVATIGGSRAVEHSPNERHGIEIADGTHARPSGRVS